MGLLIGSLLAPLTGRAQTAPRFESDILPIFENNCFFCHGDGIQEAGLDLRTPGSVLKGGGSGPAVTPGAAENSLLFEKVVSGEMPLGGNKLDSGEIELIGRWIDSGASIEAEDFGRLDAQANPGHPGEREVLVTILAVKCLSCHGRRIQQGELDARTRAGLLKGGKSGPAIVPGEPDQSLLIQRIESDEMPPREALSAYSVRPISSSELEKLRRWIAAGAPAQSEGTPATDSASESPAGGRDDRFWSFRSPRRPSIPKVRGENSVRTPIDAFLLDRLESKGLTFSSEASRLTLMRRAYFDLIGLPPTPEEIEEYLADQDSSAYERLIDRLLASPHYGERWARYWLDAAGYSDSEGQVSADAIRPHAYRYRDYIIRSLNQDKPYDQLLTEQLAGDELFDYKAVKELSFLQRDNLVATGFLRMAPDGTYSTSQNFVPMRLEVVAGQVEVLSSAVMGLTLACARCHDHKFDPISQQEYYGFSAILRSAYDPYDWLSPSTTPVGPKAAWDETNTRFLPSLSEKESREVEAHNAPFQQEIETLERSLESIARPLRQKLFSEKLMQLPSAIRGDVRAALDTSADQRSAEQKYLAEKFQSELAISAEELEERFTDYRLESEKIKAAITAAREKLWPAPQVRALFDMGDPPTPTHLLGRGDYRNPGPPVEPGVPSVLRGGLSPYKVESLPFSTKTSGRRLALARWLTQPSHPLTTRVMVNRIWQHHFGRGLVSTPGNFGKLGSPPSHPELLDWLATEFVRRGWRIKAMHRLIMTSTAYRQDSRIDPKLQAADPDNVLLSRYPLTRLDADALRDSILKVAGRLDTTPFGRADDVEVMPDGEVVGKGTEKGARRSIYLLQRRKTPVTMLEIFDAPQLNPNCLKRPRSGVSSQALQMMNSDTVRENSRYMAGRIIDAVGADVEKQIERVFLTALCRRPSAEEVKTAKSTLYEVRSHWRQHLDRAVPAEPKEYRAQWLALATLCHTILNSAEFLYID